MWFSTFVLKNVTRRPLRSALTVLAIAIGVGTVVALVGVAVGFERSFLDLYEGSGWHLIVSRAGGQGFSTSLPEKMGGDIRAIPGVKDVVAGLADPRSLEEKGVYTVLQGWVPGSRQVEGLNITAGRNLRPGDGRVCLLGTVLADNLGKKVGDTVVVQEGERFEVVGIFGSRHVFENGSLVMPLKELQRLLGKPGQVDAFSVVLEDPRDTTKTNEIRQQIEAMGNGIRARTVQQHVESMIEVKLAKAMSWLTSALAFLAGAFGMMNTMVMSVQERTREIGILRAIGWRPWRVVRMVLMEAAALSLIGGCVGTVGAIILLRVLTRLPMVNGLISGHIQPLLIVEGFVIAVLVGLVCGALPARRAAAMTPTAALRYE
ncbi:MAG TPA: ABC transporter permease [Gemmataceae bacterium]|nr:ABC transporter permease [Gemmataceae bacterium]